jgi:hypothetical protein
MILPYSLNIGEHMGTPRFTPEFKEEAVRQITALTTVSPPHVLLAHW